MQQPLKVLYFNKRFDAYNAASSSVSREEFFYHKDYFRMSFTLNEITTPQTCKQSCHQ